MSMDGRTDEHITRVPIDQSRVTIIILPIMKRTVSVSGRHVCY